MDTAEVDLQTGIVDNDIIGTDAAEQILQGDGTVETDTGLLSNLQIGIATVCHPSRGQFVVIKTDRTDSPGRVARLTSCRAGSLLTHQASVGLFIDVYSFHWSD